MAGLFGIPGTEAIGTIDFGAIFSTLGRIITFIVLAAIVAVILGIILFRRKNEQLYNIKIHFFRDVNGRPVPTNDYTAAELTVPNTSIIVFHIKEIDTYIPRGTKPMGKNSYWYYLLNNGEIMNFDIPSMNKELAEAKLYYDHTDTRYAHENLKQIIKREYRDKAVKWWKEYKEVISLVILVFVMTLSFIFIISKVASIIDKLAPLIDAQKETTAQLKEVLKYMTDLKAGSGVVIK